MRFTSGDHGDETLRCPDWCRRTHAPSDHTDDRLHASGPVFVPVVSGDPRFGRDDGLGADALVLRVIQRPGSPTAWIEAVPEEGRSLHLLVTAESARRIADAMAELLTLL